MDDYETLSLFPEDRSERSRGRGMSPGARRLVVLVTGLAMLTAAAVVSWTRDASTAPKPAAVVTPAKAEPGPPAAYLPGGSVYEQQVPGVLRSRCTD